jgi:hypothetical protein
MNELITKTFRAVQNEKMFLIIQITDPKNNLLFEGKLYTEQLQTTDRIPDLDKKLMDSIRDIPNLF